MADGYLTTHVLDTAKGKPAAGMTLVLYHIVNDTRVELARTVTNTDGRTDGPILPKDSFQTGSYELVFKVGDWLGEAAFLDEVPIRFVMSEEAHYHVPLLVSPFGYSTYRGS